MKSVIKKTYRLVPFKKEIFSLVKKIWTPPQSIYQHLYFEGLIDVQLSTGEQFKIMHHGYQLENELFWEGLGRSWEKTSLSIWEHLSEVSTVIFDIGANTGIFALVAKAKNPTASVHAFEPFPAIYKKLAHNAAINHYDITCNCTALSNYSGDAVIYTEDENFAYSVTVNQNLWVKDTEPITINITATTLNEYIEKNNIQSIDLMKIDVETHEPEVMEGFSAYFLKFKPVILIEVLNDEIAAKLSGYFSPEVFDFFDIDEQLGLKKVAAISKSIHYNFLIVPKEKSHLYNEKGFIYS